MPSDSKAIVPTIKKARDAGLKVIVLDTPLDPMDAADATFATDNRKAGQLIGQWAAGTLGDKAKDAKIVFLDLATNQPTVDYLRDQGFMQGFGIDVKDPNKYGDEDDRAHLHARDQPGRPGKRPHGDGERAAEVPGRQRGLHDQRAGRGRRLGSAQGSRQG